MKPFKVKILGSDFKVSYEDLNEETSGIAESWNRSILIDPNLPRDVQNEVYWHEVIHMMLALTGVSELLEEKQEEAVVQSLGYSFHRFFIENFGNIKTLYRTDS